MIDEKRSELGTVVKSGEELETSQGYFYQDKRGNYFATKTREREIPRVEVHAETYPAAYELALIGLWRHGVKIATHYDRPGDPPSVEAHVSVDIADPLKEPRVHKFIPSGIEGLENYRLEVVDRIHDSWVGLDEHSWTYTYAQRLFEYNPSINLYAPNGGVLLEKGIDQMQAIVNDLKRDMTSKGAIATTWMPTADPGLESNRPCLQSLWIRAYEKENVVGLNPIWMFRSRDVKAWFMNSWALTSLVVEKIAKPLEKLVGKPVALERIQDQSYSLHFYGQNQKEFEGRFPRFRTDEGFEDRTYNTGDIQDLFDEERKRVEENPHYNINQENWPIIAQKIIANPNPIPTDVIFVKKFFPEMIKDAKWDPGWFHGHEHFMAE